MESVTGKQNITIIDVAQKAGLSSATAGRVLGGYGNVSGKARLKVMKAAKELGYMPNAIAQSMKSQVTKTIGVLVGNIANPFFSEIIHSIEVKGAEAGYSVIIANTGEDIDEEVKAIKTLYAKRIDGLIIATAQPNDMILDASKKRLYAGAVPVVYIDRELLNVNELTIKADNFSGSYEATRYLIQKGHENIGLIASIFTSTMYERIGGYKKALSDAGIPYHKEYIKIGSNASVEEGNRFTKELLAQNTELTALFVLNNITCTGALLALREMNRKIGRDISFIAWDDFELAKILDPPLTTVTQDPQKMGELAAEKLFEKINAKRENKEWLGESTIVLKTQMIERQSCCDINLLK